ncbi:MAG: hypothetical protein WAV28_09585 [Sedimentisphaerales bacterium]
MATPVKEPSKPRLVFEGSIEGESLEWLLDQYAEIKYFLNSFGQTYTLHGYIALQIEGCCPEPKKGTSNAKTTETP